MTPPMARLAVLVILCFPAGRAVAETSVPTSSDAAPAAPAAPSPSAPSGAPAEPFAFADFTWLTGNARTKKSPLSTPAFTGELRVDVDYVHDFNHPRDHTIVGSSEIFRSGEVHVVGYPRRREIP